MRKLFAVVFCVFFLFSCGTLDGLLSVSTEIGLKNAKGKIVKLAPAMYKFTAKVKNKENGKLLKFKIKVNNKEEKINFMLPEFKENDHFIVSADESGQDYILDVKTNFEESETETYQRVQSCYIGSDLNGHPMYGTQEIEYYYEVKYYQINGFVLAPYSGKKLASFDADKKEEREVITYQGYCRR